MNLLRFGSLLLVLVGSEAFTTSRNTPFSVNKPLTQPALFRTKPVYIFGRNNKDGDGEGDDSTSGGLEGEEGEQKRPFFARILRQRGQDDTASIDPLAPSAEKSGATNEVLKSSVAQPKEPENPVERAKSLRSQAERARLEAERMDAELTLSKIEKLEKQLKVANTKGESVEELQRQLDNLQAKLRGEPPKSNVPRETKAKTEEKQTVAVVQEIETTDLTPTDNKMTIDLANYMNGDSIEETQATIESSPKFIQRLLANLMEMDYDSESDLDTKEMASRVVMTSQGDFSFSNRPKPTFTEDEIADALRRLEASEVSCPDKIVESVAGDRRKMAEYILEMEYYIESKFQTAEDVLSVLAEAGGEEEIFQGLIEALNATALDQYITTLYPKCTRKEDGPEPTEAQVKSLAGNVLPKVKFQANSKPEKVLGGYIIPGSHKYENGDDLIEAIDSELEKMGLADKMTVLLVEDFSQIAKAAEEETDIYLFETEGQMLYVMGPDLVREAKPVQLSIASGLGLATSWYLSIYPFLLNTGLSQRVEEQISVADAGMTYDLGWLTDLSVPLFFYFIGIQVLHEIAHWIVASEYGLKLSAPTFVPSLISGITSSVTSFKSLPKNKQAMFDVSIIGPFVGILASLSALLIGSQLTLSSDPAILPSLPVDILRQSTLGGSIVDKIIQGSLYVPEGAPSAGLMVSLHPLAVAGYISLIVNALALLPVGTTDGGRIALSMLGRNPKVVVGYLTMATLLFTGLFGSDLFLFYFAFVIAFQTGNEVPARNEIDELDAFRVALGGLGFATAFLALVPFQ